MDRLLKIRSKTRELLQALDELTPADRPLIVDATDILVLCWDDAGPTASATNVDLDAAESCIDRALHALRSGASAHEHVRRAAAHLGRPS